MASSANSDTTWFTSPESIPFWTCRVECCGAALIFSPWRSRLLLHEARHVSIRSDSDGHDAVPQRLPDLPRPVGLTFPNCQCAAVITDARAARKWNNCDHVCGMFRCIIAINDNRSFGLAKCGESKVLE